MRRTAAAMLGVLAGGLGLPLPSLASAAIGISSITITPTPGFIEQQVATVSFVSRDITVSMPGELGRYASASFRGGLPGVSRPCAETQPGTTWHCGDSDGPTGTVTITYASDRLVGNPPRTYTVTVSAANYGPTGSHAGETLSASGTVTLETGTQPTSDLAISSFALVLDGVAGANGTGPVYDVAAVNNGPDATGGSVSVMGLGSTAVLDTTPGCRAVSGTIDCALPAAMPAASLVHYQFQLNGDVAGVLTLTAAVSPGSANVDPRPGNNTMVLQPVASSGGTGSGQPGGMGGGSGQPGGAGSGGAFPATSGAPTPTAAPATDGMSPATDPGPVARVPAAGATQTGSSGSGWLWAGVAALALALVSTPALRRRQRSRHPSPGAETAGPSGLSASP